jgi:SEC-C motif domain protein
MKYCPCGSQKRYLDCCGAYLQKKAIPETPVALMRSRYTAYAEGDFDYIQKTMRAPALLKFNKKKAKKDPVQWLGLTVIQSTNGPNALNNPNDPNNPNIAFVEFKANYKQQGLEGIIHEKSEFHFIENRWYYVDGQHFPS